jgi:hypothetical protein
MVTQINYGGKTLRLNLEKFSSQSSNKCLLGSVATLDVEEQFWLGSEGTDKLDLNRIDVNTELDDKCFDGGDIC